MCHGYSPGMHDSDARGRDDQSPAERPHDAQQDPSRDRVGDFQDDPDPTDPSDEDVDELDPDAPGRWLFEDGDGADAPEPNEPA